LETLTEGERRFARTAVRRKRLFLGLTIVGVAAAAALSVFYGYRRLVEPGYAVGARAALVVLILLNARQNLRQYRYAAVLDKLMRRRGGDPAV
jgi:energy-converting hydrogenase Eha subunit B